MIPRSVNQNSNCYLIHLKTSILFLNIYSVRFFILHTSVYNLGCSMTLEDI